MIRTPSTSRIVRRDEVAAHDQAERIRTAAGETARRIVEEATRDAERIREEARREGAEAARAEVARDLAHAARLRLEAVRRAQDEIIALGVALAKRVVGRVIRIEPSLVTEMAEELVRRFERARQVKVRVAPADEPALLAHWAERPEIAIEADPRLDRGDCIVETDLGTLDGRIDVRLEALERALGDESR